MKTEIVDNFVPDEIGKTQAFTDGTYICFIKLDSDDCPESPTEWDGFGKFYSLSTRHYNYNPDCPTLLELEPDSVPLSYFEHGQCKWGVMGSMGSMPDFRWDGVEFAGVWQPDQYIKQEADSRELKRNTSERMEYMKEQAASACKTYTQWCNGDVYGYSIDIYKLRHHESGEVMDEEDDYRFDDAVVEDACWGFFGYDEAERALNDCLDGIELEDAVCV